MLKYMSMGLIWELQDLFFFLSLQAVNFLIMRCNIQDNISEEGKMRRNLALMT